MSTNLNAGTRMFYVRNSDGQAYCFSPVPLISDTKELFRTIKDGTQTRLGTRHTVSFNGTLLPDKPALSGVSADATCLELLDRKSDQLCSALDEDGGNLLVVDATGYPVMSVFARVISIDFPESQMVDRRQYNVVFEFDEDFDTNCRVSSFDENWQFDQQEDDTISVSHSVSAVGISDLPAGTGAVQNAKTTVLARANVLDAGLPVFLKAPFVPSIVDVDSLFEFNHVRAETINESEGSYDISESWILASGAFKDDRSIQRQWTLEDTEVGQQLIETFSIDGSIDGYGETTIEKLTNARDGFNLSVAPEIGFFATSGIVSRNFSENRFAGNVSYAIEYGPAIDGDHLTGKSITRSLDRNEDGSVTQNVTTSAQVRPGSPSGIEAAIDFCFANNFPLDSFVDPLFTASLSGNLETVGSQRDDTAKSFSLTRTFRDQETSNYREEYNVSRQQNVENATTTVTVQGSVFGLSSESSTKSTDRFVIASGAFFGTVEPLARTRALAIIPSGTCIGTSSTTSTLGFNELGGAITYNFTFDNRFVTSNPNIFDEKIDISITLQSDVIAEMGIPGKSDGPILQDQETKTGLRKALKIQYTMRPSGQDCSTITTSDQLLLENEALTESSILVDNTLLENSRGEKPIALGVFKTADQYTFNRQTLVFGRSVTWQYTAT